MKILLLTNHMRPGGVPAYCLMLARGLREKGCEVWIASDGGAWEEDARAAASHFVQLPLDTSAELNPSVWLSYLKLKRLVKEQRIEIVHAQTRVTQVMAALLARQCRIGFITTCHGYFKQRLFRRLLPLWGDRVIAISSAVQMHLQKDWSVPASKIDVVHHGIRSLPAVSASPDVKLAARQRLRIDPKAFVVGALGRYSPVKGYATLISAISVLKDSESGVHALLVGQGPQHQALVKLSRECGVESRVSFQETPNPREDFFEAIDLFCAPSIEEGFGLAVLESMARGVAVLASDVGGIPDLVQSGTNGLLVPPGDAKSLSAAILALKRDPALLARFAERGRHTATEQFAVAPMIDKTIQVYQTQLNATRNKARETHGISGAH